MVERVVTQCFQSQGSCWRVRSLALTLIWVILLVVSIGAIAQESRNPDCYSANGTGCAHDVTHPNDWDRIKSYQQNFVACLVGLGHCDHQVLMPVGGNAQERRNPDGYPADGTQPGELSAARDEIQKLKAQLSEMSAAGQQASSAATSRDQALKREQEKTDTLTRELADARKELDAAKAERTKISDNERKTRESAAAKEQALGREQAKADALARELEGAQREMEAVKTQLSKVSDAERRAREQEEALGRERAKVKALEAALVAARQQLAAASQITKTPESHAQAEPEPASTEAARLLARGQALLKRADIAAARAVLQLAMAEGSAEAAFMLGQTYDEKMLSQWNVLGTQADAKKARELYRRAYNAGYAQAKQLVETMGQEDPERPANATAQDQR